MPPVAPPRGPLGGLDDTQSRDALGQASCASARDERRLGIRAVHPAERVPLVPRPRRDRQPLDTPQVGRLETLVGRVGGHVIRVRLSSDGRRVDGAWGWTLSGRKRRGRRRSARRSSRTAESRSLHDRPPHSRSFRGSRLSPTCRKPQDSNCSIYGQYEQVRPSGVVPWGLKSASRPSRRKQSRR